MVLAKKRKQIGGQRRRIFRRIESNRIESNRETLPNWWTTTIRWCVVLNHQRRRKWKNKNDLYRIYPKMSRRMDLSHPRKIPFRVWRRRRWSILSIYRLQECSLTQPKLIFHPSRLLSDDGLFLLERMHALQKIIIQYLNESIESRVGGDNLFGARPNLFIDDVRDCCYDCPKGDNIEVTKRSIGIRLIYLSIYLSIADNRKYNERTLAPGTSGWMKPEIDRRCLWMLCFRIYISTVQNEHRYRSKSGINRSVFGWSISENEKANIPMIYDCWRRTTLITHASITWYWIYIDWKIHSIEGDTYIHTYIHTTGIKALF